MLYHESLSNLIMKISLFSAAPLLFILMSLHSCKQKKSELKWEKNLPVIGSQSSLRTADLNQDGILDLVIGAGKNEFQHSERGVLAFNGSNGELLWQQESDDQIFGSATFLDVTGDGIEDVFIGGRSATFLALNGKNGDVLWRYSYIFEDDPILKYVRFNFYNSVLVPDLDNDGIRDILTVNGGNTKAPANSERDRFPGVLLVFSAKNGSIIAADTMPDGNESYMSPVAYNQPNINATNLIFGSGGETISGSLYHIMLKDFIEDGLQESRVIAKGNTHGFIAPPSIADINQDGYYDIVTISHESSVFAINGVSKDVIWTKKIENTESSNSFAVGQFTEDEIPDFFTFVSKGKWPDNRGSLQVLLNGKNGKIEFLDSIGCTGFSSPVVYDFNKDGIDDAILSINEFDCSQGFLEKISSTISNKLISIDFAKQEVNTIDQTPKFKNIFTTPWIGDLDNDGYVDIVYAQYYSENSYLTSFLGMRVRRISSSIKLNRQVSWGAYMGSAGDGIYPIRQ
jgi:hypothetical protein